MLGFKVTLRTHCPHIGSYTSHKVITSQIHAEDIAAHVLVKGLPRNLLSAHKRQ
jgi:hypothetical protein